MIQFNSVSVLALVAVAMCWSLAVVLYRVGTTGSVARKLSLLLLVEGITLISTGYIDSMLAPELIETDFYPSWVLFEGIVHTVGDGLMLVLYPPFLAAALGIELTRPFESKSALAGLTAIATISILMVYFLPLPYGPVPLYLLLCALFGYALVASIQAWRASIGAARSRARSFALAFGIRDVCWFFVYGAAIWLITQDAYSIVDMNTTSPVYVIYALGTLLAVPLIAYGILRTQLFDIDLRIQWTIKQSTLAAIFVALVYLISEGADRFLSEELGNWAGLLASALVVFFLAPLQRFAERVASAAMPNTHNTPEYAAFRKMQVYESSVSDALIGGVSEKERVLLNTLRDTLGISPADAMSLEKELLQGKTG
ncbi:MAG: hypothetical protein GWP67_07300 [Gammaproteobacteria bacterium]|jgi:hypothetical protein|nr:hypothetical protein [Gammaproteobacteria bacterium]